jgi:DNA-directed RNA polymerase specialized sigma24 family protein
MRRTGVEQRSAQFAAFYEENRAACLTTVAACVGDRLLAEDLVAESFARAWASWRTVNNHPAPKA